MAQRIEAMKKVTTTALATLTIVASTVPAFANVSRGYITQEISQGIEINIFDQELFNSFLGTRPQARTAFYGTPSNISSGSLSGRWWGGMTNRPNSGDGIVLSQTIANTGAQGRASVTNGSTRSSDWKNAGQMAEADMVTNAFVARRANWDLR